jgi:hypothetical protein
MDLPESTPGRELLEKTRRRGDRRTHPRLDCGGDVEMRILPDGPKEVGSLRDLGLGGCRIRFNRALTIHRQSDVEVQIRVDGVTLRLAGVVRRVEERRDVALEFTAVSNRKAEQILFLLTEMFEKRQERLAEAEQKLQELKKSAAVNLPQQTQ